MFLTISSATEECLQERGTAALGHTRRERRSVAHKIRIKQNKKKKEKHLLDKCFQLVCETSVNLCLLVKNELHSESL